MSWQEEDERFLLAAVEELDQFLSSDQPNWRLRRSAGMLTLGNLFLSMRRLESLSPGSFAGGISDAINSIKNILARRSAVVQARIKKEIPARLRVWENLLEEIHDDAQIDASYGTLVRNRVILELLTQEDRFTEPATENQIAALDATLRSLTYPGDFLWDEKLKMIFEPLQFWYLYVMNRGESV